MAKKLIPFIHQLTNERIIIYWLKNVFNIILG